MTFFRYFIIYISRHPTDYIPHPTEAITATGKPYGHDSRTHTVT